MKPSNKKKQEDTAVNCIIGQQNCDLCKSRRYPLRYPLVTRKEFDDLLRRLEAAEKMVGITHEK